MPLTLRYVVAEVFTDTPATGNQLAVFKDERDGRRDDAGAPCDGQRPDRLKH
jgi:predicted PhzF superfamily epimerase YddE/YHI9